MFGRILVPLDGSQRAERAIPVAARIAQASGGAIIFLRAVEPPVAYETFTTEQEGEAEHVAKKFVGEAADYLSSLARAEALQGIAITTEEVVGTPAQTILDYVTSSRPDLIVLCSHGYSGFKRWALGSVADKVIHHAPVPVLLVRQDGPTLRVPDAERPLRVMVTLDGSDVSEAVLEPVTQLVEVLAPPSQGRLHLLHVVDTSAIVGKHGESADAERIEHMKQQAMEYLTVIADKIRTLIAPSCELPITYSVKTAPDIATAIIQSGESIEDTEGLPSLESYDLIAMATHGHGALTRWTMGSVTERVLHGTRLPMLLVRSRREE